MTLAEAPITAQPSSPSTVATPRRASPVSMVATVALIAAIGLGLGLLAGMLSKTSGRDLIGVDHVSQPVVAAVVILGL